MIQKELAIIKSKETLALNTVEMVLENEHISNHAIPGQFIHILVDGHILRRPISIADVDRNLKTITILFKVVGSGTEALAKYEVYQTLNVLGPNGNGFTIKENSDETVLLLGGGIGVPPMYYLGKSLKEQGKNVIAILGFQSSEHVFYEEKFKEIGNTFVVTDDGSYGDKGFVTDVLSKVEIFDRYYACGPIAMLKAITSSIEGKPGYISLEERMGCGVGACFACVIPTKSDKGYKKICSDGPVFDAEEVLL